MKARNPMVIHYVRNMQRATAFYVQVFDVQTLAQSSGWTTLDFGAIELALHILPEAGGSEGPLPHAGLNLEVDDIEQMQAAVERCGGHLRELIEPRDGVPVRVALFTDSEGNGFELRQQP